jgi:flagellar protein FliO/FliZ
MWDLLFYVALIALVAVLIVLGAVVVRGYMTGTSPTAGLFGPRPDPRIDISEQASIDGRRRLLLIRRDDVEHLVMTGGPVDVVIETGIVSRRAAVVPLPQPASPAYERGSRGFGQKVSDG